MLFTFLALGDTGKNHLEICSLLLLALKIQHSAQMKLVKNRTKYILVVCDQYHIGRYIG